MKVFFTHGYFIEEDPKEKEIMRPYPPLGMLYVYTHLKEQQIDCEIFDTTFSDKKSQYTAISSSKPDVLAIYTNLMTKLNVLELIQKVKGDSSLSHTKVVLGGPDVTYNIENYLKNGADYIIIGEGEITMEELVQELRKENPEPKKVNGIAFKEQEKIIQTAGRDKLKELKSLPIPARADIPIEKYLNAWKEHHGKRTANISTQRGCPYTCKWCSTAVYGQSYRRRPAHEVVKEIIHLQNEHQVEALWFVDDVFTVSHKWIDELLEEFQKNKLSIPFECITRAERLNDEVLNKLKQMGCFRIWIGAESGSQKIINKMDRRVDVDIVRETIIKTKQYGMEAGTFIMIGYPEETLKDIKATAEHLKIATPSQVTVTKAYPIKGTDLYHEIERQITVQPAWEKSTDRDIDFKRKYSSRFYDYAIKYVMNTYFAEKNKAQLLQFGKYKLKATIARSILSVLK